MGAMVFGGVPQERIALNEGTFWSGRPHDYDNPEAHKYFGQIRDLVFAEKFQEAEKLVDEHFFGVPAAQQAYQPLGDLLLTFDGEPADGLPSRPPDRRRDRRLSRGRRPPHSRIFVSYPDRVMVVRPSPTSPAGCPSSSIPESVSGQGGPGPDTLTMTAVGRARSRSGTR